MALAVEDHQQVSPSFHGKDLPDFYHDLQNSDITEKFRDFDDPTNFLNFQRAVADAHSRNFVIDFADDEAWCGFNLGDDEIKALVSAGAATHDSTRWINIWLPYKQREILATLAKHYDFSPRLFELMKSEPIQDSSQQSDAISHSSLFKRMNHYHGFHRKAARPGTSGSSTLGDPEDQLGTDAIPLADLPLEPSFGVSHYQMVDEVWHWATVDEGRHYVCLGYNSLHNIKVQAPLPATEGIESRSDDLPDGKRVWSWLILCEDRTVISIHEDPYPYSNGHLPLKHEDHYSLLSIRRNLLNVFRNISKAHDTSKDPAIAILPIRRRIGSSAAEAAHRPSDAPGLLFYYLFDDWYTTYNLVARREHKYAELLEKVRVAMLSKAELKHVNQLHRIGRQLAVLKRLYSSYEAICDRVLERHEATLASLKNSHVIGDQRNIEDSIASSGPHIPEAESMLGVSLSSAARARFKRLKDRTRLYALSEIQECLDQKESLVMMNFNLIAIKESLSVERLTRITLLLAKVTILFMPVSFMAAYFSCQFEGVEFTVGQFWTWFGIVGSVSALALVTFSFVSGTFEGKMMYRSFSRAVLDWNREWLGRRTGKGKNV
ncbi:uncharacterized protein K452DRAFT_243330 [Aplosporella prunicola CBS 121167]|uniref:Uncharacterized protein n=1 Tax=Aplosporella prunicola CBS 121167 TaxID=1176127 RepID=A0A6A6BMM5_9PEZI|nr:uncharacterized protein K452DRAFT_243330 [Aplosporella prunicola CBS 121167]KAF2145370.1 hypothetical protein K452DRAFT_243330 [Aplosporella prunicola CBS 121167]